MRPHFISFTYSVIRTTRVVEQAFGRLKGSWRIPAKSKLNDPVFASVEGSVCCGLHYICERYKCPYEGDILPDPADFENGAEDGDPDLLRSVEGGQECHFRMFMLDKLQVWFTFLNSYLVIQYSKQS